MEAAFPIVLVVVVAAAAVIAVASFAGSGKAYDQIGKGGLSLRDGTDRPADEPAPSGAAAVAERDDEVRQMLEARNARRRARGQPELDVEAELRRLTAPAVDPSILAEVRELVESRNARRVRQGKEPLDVEAEVARRLRDALG